MKEIITGRTLTISIEGKNEAEVNSALEKAFKLVQEQAKRGKYYMSPKKIGSAAVCFSVEETATHV
jgi:hypothetical protein